MSDNLQSAIQRLLAGDSNDADLQAIVSAVQTGRLVLAPGTGSVAVGHNVENSQIIPGNNNVIGDNNIYITGANAELIQTLLYQRSPVLPEALIQQVRSRASEKVLRNFGKIQLLNRRKVDVDQLYVDVYVLEVQDYRANIPGLLKGQNVREQFDRLGLAKRGERLQGLQVAESEDYPRLMVLGKPGSGKSTFLRHLAVGCAKGDFLEDYIPYLLELRDVDETDFSLFRHVHEEFELDEEEQTKQLLRQGKVLVLLDGLDEVSSALQQKLQDELRRFARRYDKNRFVLTCRTQAIEYIPEQFSPVEVADFKLEQIESFALNWFRALAKTPEEGEVLKEHFMEKLGEHPQTAELAVTPVFLSLTCWIFEDSKSLPEKRSDLYQEGLDLLLRQWDDRRGISRVVKSGIYRALTLEERKQLLIHLAVRKFEQKENFVLFDKAEICSYIAEHLQISTEESRAVLESVAEQHGILVERAHEIWSFSHLTFQEYLVSLWFCRYSESPKRLVDFVANDNNAQWRETFTLAVEMSDRVDYLLQELQKKVESEIVHNTEVQRLLNWIFRKSNSVSTSYKSAAIRIFYFYISQAMPFIIISKLPDNRHGNLEFDLEIDLKLSYLCTGKKEFDYPNISSLDKKLGSDTEGSLTEIEDLEYDAFREDNFPGNYIFILNEMIELSQNNLFRNELVSLLRKAPVNLMPNSDVLKRWWKEHGKEQQCDLKDILTKHRNVQLEWHFDNEQNRSLWKYYEGTKLLLDCLAINSSVSADLRRHIEDKILLPVGEIENLK